MRWTEHVQQKKLLFWMAQCLQREDLWVGLDEEVDSKVSAVERAVGSSCLW